MLAEYAVWMSLATLAGIIITMLGLDFLPLGESLTIGEAEYLLHKGGEE